VPFDHGDGASHHQLHLSATTHELASSTRRATADAACAPALSIKWP
jgi:hypothetical protein